MRLKTLVLSAVGALLLASVPASLRAEEKMKPEELVAKHLQAIGTPEARAAVKTRSLQGQVAMTVLMGGAGTLTGPAGLDSDIDKIHFFLKLSHPQYVGEEFVYDGTNTSVASSRPGSRSPLAQFMFEQSDLLKEGLFGGVLSSHWALANLQQREPKLSYDGLKTINGRKLHQLSYKKRKGSNDVNIRLYFEPETYRHVLSVYSITRVSGLGRTGEFGGSPESPDSGPQVHDLGQGSAEVATARQQESRIKVEEMFSDFVTFDGVTLPTKWNIHYTAETGRRALLHEYLITASRIENNAKLENASFKVSPDSPR